MKKWQNLAPRDDPGSWYDMDGFWPTSRGSYEVADAAIGGSISAATPGTVAYAFSAPNTTSYFTIPDPHYIVTDTKIWYYSSTGASVADKTNGVSIGTTPRMIQYGNITICVMGSAATVNNTSLGGNFSALAGAPQARCITTLANAVVVACTSTNGDGWATSDVGDYTNWSTGEASSGRIYAPEGSIVAAVTFNNAVYFFKQNSIHRMTYVGGDVKWAVEKLFDGIGCGALNNAVAGRDGILFRGLSTQHSGETEASANSFYWFDGVSRPVLVNPLTAIGVYNSFTNDAKAHMVYEPRRNLYTVWDVTTATPTAYFFSPDLMAWGKSTLCYGTTPGTVIPVHGNYQEMQGWVTANDDLTLFSSPLKRVGSPYIQSSMYGVPDGKTLISRVTPILRRRVDLGSQAASLTTTFYRELHDTTASSTQSGIAESTERSRFDFRGSDNFARFKVTYTDYDVEIDDLLVGQKKAGLN